MASLYTESLISHPKYRLIQAPAPFPISERATEPSLFLAGSWALGLDWQTPLKRLLSHLPVTIIDPYRADWDGTWIQDISFTPFREQVEWELELQETATVMLVYFAEGTQAPISLLEFGLWCREKPERMVVYCPDGWWRKGNIQIVCKKWGVKLVETVEDCTKAIETKFKKGSGRLR
jgi:hypothetical protein